MRNNAMLEFPCRHCGNVQFLHEEGYYDEGWCMDGIVARNASVSEEHLLMSEIDGLRQEARENHNHGYHYNLSNCPGFEHRICDFGLPLIERAFDCNLEWFYLPDGLHNQTKELFEQWEEEKQDNELPMYGQSHVYIAFNPRIGGSSIAIGE